METEKRSRLNILIVTGSLTDKSGGPYYSVKSTAEHLAAMGNTVIVIGTKDSNSQVVDNWNNCIVKAFNKVGPFSWHYVPQLRFWLDSLPYKIDVIAIQGIWMIISAQVANWAIKRNIPYIISIRGALNPEALKFSKFKKRISSFLYMNRVLKKAKCIHALNKYEVEAIKNYGLKVDICTIPNGITIDDLKEPRPEDLQLEIPSDSNVMVYLGRVHPIKNLLGLIKAWAYVKKENVSGKNWVLVIAGPQNYAGYLDELKKTVKENAIEQSVVFYKSCYDKQKVSLLKRASCFVLPSFSEGFPMAILDALASGLPVLYTKECKFPEVAETGAGYEVNADIESLINGLKRVFSLDNEKLRKMGNCGYEFVRQEYTWNTICSQLVTVYNRMFTDSFKTDVIAKDVN